MPKDVPLRRINHRQKTARARAVVELEGATVLDSTDNYPPIPPEPPAPVTFIPAVVWTEEDAEANYSAYSYVGGDVTSLGTGAESMGLFYGVGGAGAKVEIDGMAHMGVVDGVLYGAPQEPATLYEWDGEAWSEVRALHATAGVYSSVAFGADGRIHVAWTAGVWHTCYYAYTDDQGATWSDAVEIASTTSGITCCRVQDGCVFVSYGTSAASGLARSANNGTSFTTATVRTGDNLDVRNYGIGFSGTHLYYVCTEPVLAQSKVYLYEYATPDWKTTEWLPTLVRTVDTSTLAPTGYVLFDGYAHLTTGWPDDDYRGLFLEGYINGPDERTVVASLDQSGEWTQIHQSGGGTPYAYVHPAQYGSLASF